MASLGHVAVGLATGRAWSQRGAPAKSVVKASLVFAALSTLPDADIVAFKLGIAYEHPLGHRGATHSLVFVLLCTALAWAVSKPLKLEPMATALATLVAVGTHPLLDTLTTGGLGCALLWPFSNERFFAPLRAIPVAPLGLGMLSLRGLQVVAFELVFFSPLLVYAALRRWGLAAVLATAAMLAGVGLVRESSEEPAFEPPPAYVVTASRDGASVAALEAEVAEPLEKRLSAAGAQRLRTRIGGGTVRIEVWGAQAPLEGVTVERTNDFYFLVRSARPAGALCGPEEPRPHVRIDPLRLAALHVSGLDVEKRVKALPLEELSKLPLNDDVRLGDVATVEVASPPARCTVEAGDEPAWLVRAPEVAGATRLVSRIEATRLLPSLKPAAVTRESPSRVTLWFTEPYDALKELAALGGQDVRHVDGVSRVRIIVKGPARENVAAAIAAGLKAPLVVKPLPPVRRVDVKVDAARARTLGIPAEDIEALAALALRGREHDGVRVTVDLGEPEHLAALFIGPQRLGELLSISQSGEPAELLRENGERAVEIVAYGIAKKDVPRSTLPPGTTLELYVER